MTKAGDEIRTWAARIAAARAEVAGSRRNAHTPFIHPPTLARGFSDLAAQEQHELIAAIVSLRLGQRRLVEALGTTSAGEDLEQVAAGRWRPLLDDADFDLPPEQAWVINASVASRGREAARLFVRLGKFSHGPGLRAKLSDLFGEYSLDEEMLDLLLTAVRRKRHSQYLDDVVYAGLVAFAAAAQRDDIVAEALAYTDGRRYGASKRIIRDILAENASTDRQRELAATPVPGR